jgi:NDP-sugar pyrophosphorylase family protein
MVLAAGLGERLRPLTALRAKPAMPMLNRPLIQWTLERLARSGVSEVMVNLHHLPESVVAAVGDGRRLGLRVRYSREPTLLGTGGGPRRVRSFFDDAPFLLVNGDVLFGFDLGRLVERHRASGARATLALKRRRGPGAYSAITVGRDGRVRRIGGAGQPGGYLFTGVHVLDPRLLERLPRGRASDTVRDLYAPMLARGEAVHGARVRGRWLDIGSPSLYLEAHLESLSGGRSRVALGAAVARGAALRRSAVGAGARVDEGARVTDSVIWPGGVVEAGARLRRVIVTEGARARTGERLSDVVVLPRGRRSPLDR